jgi:hypothetical protein
VPRVSLLAFSRKAAVMLELNVEKRPLDSSGAAEVMPPTLRKKPRRMGHPRLGDAGEINPIQLGQLADLG